mmetsp:Transcript_13053/g.30783  ORF Transcript_13053/g.30783 Transcript_13053/m.30783 type:complete len:285 (+) Transcript_13053:297-1151(+)
MLLTHLLLHAKLELQRLALREQPFVLADGLLDALRHDGDVLLHVLVLQQRAVHRRVEHRAGDVEEVGLGLVDAGVHLLVELLAQLVLLQVHARALVLERLLLERQLLPELRDLRVALRTHELELIQRLDLVRPLLELDAQRADHVARRGLLQLHPRTQVRELLLPPPLRLAQLRLVALPLPRRREHLRVKVGVQLIRLFCGAVELGGAVGEQTHLLTLHDAERVGPRVRDRRFDLVLSHIQHLRRLHNGRLLRFGRTLLLWCHGGWQQRRAGSGPPARSPAAAS